MIIEVTVTKDGEHTRLERVGSPPELAKLLRDIVYRLAEQNPGARMQRLADAMEGAGDL